MKADEVVRVVSSFSSLVWEDVLLAIAVVEVCLHPATCRFEIDEKLSNISLAAVPGKEVVCCIARYASESSQQSASDSDRGPCYKPDGLTPGEDNQACNP